MNRDGEILEFHTNDTSNFFFSEGQIKGTNVKETMPALFADRCIFFVNRTLETLKSQSFDFNLTVGTALQDFEARFVICGKDKVLSIVRNVTDSKIAEKELLKMNKLKSLGVLAGGIAHDFNNILTAITANLSLARNALGFDHEIQDFVEEAEIAAIKASKLTKQLLTFSISDTIEKELANIDKIIRDAVEFNLRGTNVSASYYFNDDLWMAEVDRVQFEQVIQNIVINAVQAMPKGGTVSITTKNLELEEGVTSLGPGKYIKIQISDTGEGISLADIERVFDPYYTTKETGTGLGLATSYSIMQKHKGEIIAESSLGKGTSMIIYLPAVTKKQKKVIGKKEPSKKEDLKSARILVMDDEPSVAQALGRILQNLKLTVDTVGDGETAIDHYQQAMDDGNPYDLVILDLTIVGGMGGKETIEHLLAIDTKVTAIVSSGYSTDQILSHHEKYGFKDKIVY
jgi:signal transduction histidine kinase/CheY-like chemotaxis protein